MIRPTWLAAALCSTLLTTLAHARQAGPAPTRILEQCIEDTSSNGGHEALEGLRRLHDPSLRPFFSWLATAKGVGQRRMGVLGLAGLETPPRINPLLVSRISDPLEQASILGEALSLDYIGVEQIEQMLAWPKLEPYIEVALRARLAREGKPIDVARVQTLCESSGMSTELLGAALLAQAGHSERLEDVMGRLLGMSDPARGAIIGPFLETLRRERLTKATGGLQRLKVVYASYGTLVSDILRTWIRLAPAEAIPLLKRDWEAARGLPEKLRLAMVALDASDVAEPELYDPIASSTDHPALSAIGKLGGVLARKQPPLPAFKELIALRYLAVELWIVERARTFDDELKRDVCRALLEAWATRPTTLDPISDAVLPAAEELALIDAPFLKSMLEEACKRTDERIVTVILLAMLNQGAPPVWDVNAPPRWPGKESQGTAILVAARAMTPETAPAGWLPQLEGLASGTSIHLPPQMRAQAAWILIRLRKQEEPALARMLAGH